jgi:hypothetical protein
MRANPIRVTDSGSELETKNKKLHREKEEEESGAVVLRRRRRPR